MGLYYLDLKLVGVYYYGTMLMELMTLSCPR